MLLSMVLFCSSYALGLGNVPWIMQSEIFAYEVRGVANSISTSVCWLANLIVAATFLHLTECEYGCLLDIHADCITSNHCDGHISAVRVHWAELLGVCILPRTGRSYHS